MFSVKRFIACTAFLACAKWFAFIGISLFLSACVTTSPNEHGQEPVIIEDRAVVNGEVLPLPDDAPIRAESLRGDAPMSPVVRKLVQTAGDQRRIGNWDAAASSLERALRIEPKNGELWSRLAHIHYDRKAWNKAIQLAAKSNTLSRGNTDLLRRNWVLMADSYDALGKPVSADRYREKLAQ